jgi:ATP-binding cassette subfamily F protein uup
MARVERQLERLSELEAQLQEALGAHAADPQRLVELGGEFRELTEQRLALEEEWLAAAQQAEA